MSTADDLRAHAQRWPEDWPWGDDLWWEVAAAFCNHQEYHANLMADLPWFLLLVAEALDGGNP